MPAARRRDTDIRAARSMGRCSMSTCRPSHFSLLSGKIQGENRIRDRLIGKNLILLRSLSVSSQH
jgi:hypothetical protein